jgi:hypothetical protein
MTFSVGARPPLGSTLPPVLVVLAAGPDGAVAELQRQAGPALAVALGLSLLEPLESSAPDGALAALTGQPVGRGALAPLLRDPGLPLDDGRHWATALGAWRQPVLGVLAPPQLQTGLPAALTALLDQWLVPCLGLVQWGGPWEPQQRRLEGLPWLGVLGSDPHGEDGVALRRACAARWSVLQRQWQN